MKLLREQLLFQVLYSAIQIQTRFNHAEMEKQFCFVYSSSWRKALGTSIIHTFFYEDYTSSVEAVTDWIQ